MRKTSLSLVLLAFAAACGSSQPAAQSPTKLNGATVAKAAAVTPGLRLPATVAPTGYAVSMRMSPMSEKFTGQVDVEVTIKEATDTIWMHAAENLDVHSAEIAKKKATIARGGEEMIGLTFPEVLAPGKYSVHLAYDGKLPSRDGRGAYRQEDRGDWYVFTQFESTSARRAFPCFDEPGFKTPWTLTLEVPGDQRVFANTSETATTALPDGYKRVAFAPTKPLPSYLLAFAVGPLEVVDAGTAGMKKTPVRIIVPKGRSAEAAYAKETTPKVIEQLEKYFGIPYPYEKCDHIAVPQKGGAMENPGLITFGTSTILEKPTERSVRLERLYTSIAAHELGHIWFGDYVTTAWWDDTWLNEAFATWISAKIVDGMHADWDSPVGRANSKNGVMVTDALVSTRSIHQPITSKHDIMNAFDGITYQKGAAVIGMFENFAGKENFQKGVHAYLEHHAYGSATSAEFLGEVGAATGKKDAFVSAFSTFLDQPGLPLVTVSLACDGAPKLHLKQERYVPTGSNGATPESWSIPVCASYPGGKSCTILKDGTADLALEGAKACPAWVNANAEGVGYYRALYEGDLWARLVKNTKELSIPERITLLGDADALVHSGRMSDADVLAVVPDLVREGNRHLLAMATSLVSNASDDVADADRARYRRFVAKVFGPRATQLGWAPKAGEDDNTRVLRPVILGLVSDDEDNAFTKEARALARQWITNRKAIDPDMVGVVLTAGARNGDAALWTALHDEAKVAKDRRERGLLLGAMAEMRDPRLVQQNFAVAMSDDFDPRESIVLVTGAANDRVNRAVAYEFLKTNYDRIVARMPKEWPAYVSHVGSGFCTTKEQNDVQTFFGERTSNAAGGPRTLAQVVEHIALCTAQKPTRQASLTKFLAKY